MTAARQPYRVIVSRGFWKGYDVVVEPPLAGHPLRHFKLHDDAFAHAEELARVQGWPMHDRAGKVSA